LQKPTLPVAVCGAEVEGASVAPLSKATSRRSNSAFHSSDSSKSSEAIGSPIFRGTRGPGGLSCKSHRSPVSPETEKMDMILGKIGYNYIIISFKTHHPINFSYHNCTSPLGKEILLLRVSFCSGRPGLKSATPPPRR
jgi:hypothetical protein